MKAHSQCSGNGAILCNFSVVAFVAANGHHGNKCSNGNGSFYRPERSYDKVMFISPACQCQSFCSQGGVLCQGDPPGQRQLPYDNERAVRILQECNLVFTKSAVASAVRVSFEFFFLLGTSRFVPELRQSLK